MSSTAWSRGITETKHINLLTLRWEWAKVIARGILDQYRDPLRCSALGCPTRTTLPPRSR